MARTMCLAIAVLSLAAAPGCSSCFGGASSCRRPSFMEFRSCGAPAAAPCAAPAPACGPTCAPACEPACGPACGSEAPCCDGGGEGMSMPGQVIGQPGTFS
ncbi:MAG: hypothetical protein ACR2IT_07255 [Pirellulales bacterium]